MRLPIECRKILLFIMLVFPLICNGQGLTSSNPGEYAAIAAGEEKINSTISSQKKGLNNTAKEQAGISVAATKMKKWKKIYNSYLKAREFGERLAAGCQLYGDGVQTLSCLWDVYNGINCNPQGIFASMPMSNIYLEVATQYLRTYKSIKYLLKYGTNKNMLNGAERTQLLWNLEEELYHLNRKLQRLAICIATYNLQDVWNRAITGKIEKSNGMLATEARDRMRRAVKGVTAIYMGKNHLNRH